MSDGSDHRTRSRQRWLPLVGLLAFLVGIVLQSRSISRLRQENNALRAQLQAQSSEVTNPPSKAIAAEASDMDQKDRLELLRLRNEVRQLREQASPRTAQAQPAVPPLATTTTAQSAGDEARQLAAAALRGDMSALDKLAALTAGVRSMKPEEQAAALSGIKSAFELLGTEAGKGNASALQALWQASRIRSLQGFAVHGLGQAAGMGNEEALKPLLDPEAYFVLRSTAVSALKPAADAGNERAIQALAATAADPKQQALWLMAAEGLQTAAAGGNATAIDGLAMIAAATNQVISKEAVLALEAAARNNQPRAEEALRKLGWR